MNQQNRTDNKDQSKGKRQDRVRTKAKEKEEESTERELDKELEMTFPASDPLSIIQPAPDSDLVPETATRTNDVKKSANK